MRRRRMKILGSKIRRFQANILTRELYVEGALEGEMTWESFRAIEYGLEAHQKAYVPATPKPDGISGVRAIEEASKP